MWHGEMKIIRFITGKSVIRKIPGHPGHWREEQRRPHNNASSGAGIDVEIQEVVYKPFDDGWPEYEEPFMTVH
ncbi:MAG: hypothetical protein E4H46_03970 [Desulfobacterales bacterium]|nr:MAG: hypothetical protein E4H46_03970 [Desulfobacterales bacterium]